MDCFGTAVSMSLQYGVPLEVYVNKFSHTRFEPMGLHEEPRHPHRQEHRRLHLPLAGHHVPARLSRGHAGPPRPTSRQRRLDSAAGDAEAEPRPAATKAGGPNAGQGSAANAAAGAARPSRASRQRHAPKTAAVQRRAVGAGRRDEGRSQRRQLCQSGRTVRQLPDRCPQLRQLRRHHGAQNKT